jgi:hypothetical protein
LDAARIPPGQADQECQIPRASYESSRFGVEKQPFFGIACVTGGHVVISGSGMEEKLHCQPIRLAHRRSGIPLARGNVLSKAIPCDLRTQRRPRKRLFRRRIRQRAESPRRGAFKTEKCRHKNLSNSASAFAYYSPSAPNDNTQSGMAATTSLRDAKLSSGSDTAVPRRPPADY